MRAGLVSSTALHAGILGFMLVSFASPRPFDVQPAESMPIDIVSDSELSEMMAGKKTAPKAEQPKPLVEKVDTPKPLDNPDAKVSDKPEVKAANEPPPPPPPTPQAKPEPKPEPKPEVQKAEAKPTPPKADAKPEPKPEPPKDAEALKNKPPEPKKDEPKPDQLAKIPATPPPVPPRKPPPPKPVVQAPPTAQQSERTFNPDTIAALLDKRTPQRQAATGASLNSQATLGAPTGTAARLSQSEIDALRARLMQLWSPPAGAANPEELIVTVRIRLNIDGSLAGPPQVLSTGQSGFYMTARDSAIRAIFRGQPFDMLSPAKYEAWKDIEVTFDPRDMVRG